jgi:hypothetical protein
LARLQVCERRFEAQQGSRYRIAKPKGKPHGAQEQEKKNDTYGKRKLFGIHFRSKDIQQ